MTDNIEQAEGFSEAWLTLREPADHAARSKSLTDDLSAWAIQQSPLHCMELGAGTGSNLRYLCPLLGHDQQWTLVDNDAHLLTQVPRLIENWAKHKQYNFDLSNGEIILSSNQFSARISWLQKDLAQDLNKLPFDTAQLVCASALLDLTSAAWLEQLAALSVEHRCASMFVLNYNGKISWQGTLLEDQTMNDLLNAHQLSDKGFGNALGPDAGRFFAQQLKDHGRNVILDESNWELGPDMSKLQLALIEGWAPAAKDQDNSMMTLIDNWRDQRIKACEAGDSSLLVGHSDLLSLPPVGGLLLRNLGVK